ncbi:hypothetical protein NQZ79_g3851 [Umbelopsis isabellina]|nr:hypothetical protein NQZ79_g3851 [Umbelopsis isabellina]
MFSRHSKNNQVGVATPTSSLSNPSDVSRSPLPGSLVKYLADPMRSTAQPDIVGRYIDPMGGSIHRSGVDPMDTGA